MEVVKFEGLVNLTSEENEVLKEYIDQKIDAALQEIWKEIRELKSSKVSTDNAVTKNDIGDLLNRIKGSK
jgi:archaellum component FlaC